MKAELVVFENDRERAMMCADLGHHWESQKNIFGSETKKLLDTCEKLFNASLSNQGKKVENQLLKKIYGIAKTHGLRVKWYGTGSCCEPDRFLVSGNGFEELAFIQC